MTSGLGRRRRLAARHPHDRLIRAPRLALDAARQLVRADLPALHLAADDVDQVGHDDQKQPGPPTGDGTGRKDSLGLLALDLSLHLATECGECRLSRLALTSQRAHRAALGNVRSVGVQRCTRARHDAVHLIFDRLSRHRQSFRLRLLRLGSASAGCDSCHTIYNTDNGTTVKGQIENIFSVDLSAHRG